MTEEIKTWWEGNSTKLWRSSVSFFLGLLSFLGIFVFNKVVSMSDVYAKKEDMRCLELKIEKVDDKVSNLNNNMNQGFNRLIDKIGEIKNMMIQEKQ